MNPQQLEGVREGFVFRDAPAPWVIWLVIAPLVVWLVMRAYGMSGDASPTVRRLLVALRILLIASILALVFNPSRETLVVEKQKTLVAVLVDTSASMAHRDGFESSPADWDALRAAANLPPGTPAGDRTRLDLVKAVLEQPERKRLEELAKDHDVRVYTFGESLQQSAGVANLEARERVTALGTALERVLDEPDLRSRAVGGIIVVGDGKVTAGPALDVAAAAAKRRRIPIHTVGVGDPAALRDIELLSVRADGVALKDDELVVGMKVRNRGFPGGAATLRISDTKDGRELVREAVTLPADGEETTYDVRLKPQREGEQQWKLEVVALPGEHTTDNNAKIHAIRIRDSRLTVLYVEGVPRWEYRKFKNFLVRGQDAFTAYSLLLGSTAIQEATALPGVVPLEDFPRTEEELRRFDVIIFGDVDPDAQDRLGTDPAERRKVFENVRRFTENGGGFMMLAGESFSPRAWKDTPIEDLLPVVVDPSEDAVGTRDLLSAWKPRLTALGRIHPVMQLDGDGDANRKLWEEGDTLKGFYWWSRVKKAKPGAQVLSEHPTERTSEGRPFPLVVSGTFGEGPTLFVGYDETWRWFHLHGPKYAHQWWGNLIRYLGRVRLYAGDKRFRLTANRSAYDVGDRVTLTAYVKEKDYRPSQRQEIDVVVRAPAGVDPERRAVMKRVEDGVYERTFSAEEAGTWSAWLPPEESLGDDKISPISFNVRLSDIENREPVLDEPALKRLAADTGGRYVTLAEWDRLVGAIGAETVEVPRRREFRDLRRELWVPIVAILLATAEWILRKRFRYP